MLLLQTGVRDNQTGDQSPEYQEIASLRDSDAASTYRCRIQQSDAEMASDTASLIVINQMIEEDLKNE